MYINVLLFVANGRCSVKTKGTVMASLKSVNYICYLLFRIKVSDVIKQNPNGPSIFGMKQSTEINAHLRQTHKLDNINKILLL